MVEGNGGQEQQLTSFNFLSDDGSEDHESSFAPWGLLSRVRTALTGSAYQAATSSLTSNGAAPVAPSLQDPEASTMASASLGGCIDRLDGGPAASRPAAVGPHVRKASVGGDARSEIWPASASTSRSATGTKQHISGLSQASSSQTRVTKSTLRPGSSKLGLAPPFSLRPAPASALTSTTAAHAQPITPTSASRSGEVDEDSLGALNSAARPSPWGAVPGFPLPRDLLADDARSIRSTSSRPRSEIDSPSFAMPHLASTSATGARASKPARLVPSPSASALEKSDISAPLEASSKSPQAQFAANALFSRTRGLPSTLSIGGLAGFGPDDFGWDSRAASPDLIAVDPDAPVSRTGMSQISSAAPFRKALADDDQIAVAPDEETDPAESNGVVVDASSPRDAAASTPDGAPQVGKSGLPRSLPLIAFPTQSAEDDGDDARSDTGASIHSHTRTRLASELGGHADPRARLVSDAALRAIRRSRLRSRVTVEDVDRAKGHGEPGIPCPSAVGHSRHQSLLGGQQDALPSHGLGPHALAHLVKFLKQSLRQAKLGGGNQDWERVLLPLILSVCAKVRPRPRAGESADVRAYVKIKRIAGGEPQESAYVPGVVLSKHVATKRMASRLPLLKPRVMLLAFRMDHVSSGLFTLDRAEQEKEYTRILVARIVQLRPNLVVIRDSCSRQAIAMLEGAGVVVVWSVKQTALEAIARCCNADIITSVDRLGLDPRVGRCASLSVDTYSHALLPSARKSFMKFLAPNFMRDPSTTVDVVSGASQGGSVATIVLRGGSMSLLGRVKSVLDSCIFVAHNLRLEDCLARDEATTIQDVGNNDEDAKKMGHADRSEPADKRIRKLMRPYESHLGSASAFLHVPPPYPLVKLKQAHERLHELIHERQEKADRSLIADERAARISATEPRASAGTPRKASKSYAEVAASGSSDTLGTPRSRLASEGFQADVLPTREVDSPLDESAQTTENDQKTVNAQTPTDARAEIQSSFPWMTDALTSKVQVAGLAEVLPQPSYLTEETAYRLAVFQRNAAEMAWGALYAKQQQPLPLLPSARHLVFLASSMSSTTQRPCEGPALRAVELYSKGDDTLGSKLERMVAESGSTCPAKGCGRPRLAHFNVWVHNERRVLVVLERFVCPIPGQESKVLMWSYCKRCEQASPVAQVSSDTLCLSFSKYLELHCSAGPNSKRATCGHDFFDDHVQFFALQNLAVRFHTDPVEVRDVSLPPLHLLSRPDVEGRLKSEEASILACRTAAYFESVGARILALRYEAGLCRDQAAVTASALLLDQMGTQADRDAGELMLALTRACAETQPTDVLGLSIVRRRLQEVVVRWDREFERFERENLAAERDARRLTTSGLSRMFAEREPVTGGADGSTPLPPAAEADESNIGSGRDSEVEGLPPQQKGSPDTTPESTNTPAPLTAALPIGHTSAPPSSITSSSALSSDRLTPSDALSADDRISTSGDAPVRKAPGANPETTTITALSSPATWRRRRLQERTAEESSCTEAEPDGGAVRKFVRRLEAPRPRIESTLGSQSDASARRPILRRGKTDDTTAGTHQQCEVSPSKPRSPERVLSDNETSVRLTSTTTSRKDRMIAQSADRSQLLSTLSGPSKTASAPSPSYSPTVPSSRRFVARRGPPSSYRPPKVSEPESDTSTAVKRLAVSRIPVRSESETDDVRDGKVTRTILQRKGSSGKIRQAGAAAPASANSSTRRPLASPVLRRGTPANGPRSRVSTIARHFDKINREAERERERQQRVLAIRARRAQPVAATHARVEVFSNVLEAVQDDDSSDEDEVSATGATEQGTDANASGGEAEDEDDSDADRSRLRRASVRKDASNGTITQQITAPDLTLTSQSGPPTVCPPSPLEAIAPACAIPVSAPGSHGTNTPLALPSPSPDPPASAAMTLGRSWRQSLMADATDERGATGSLLKTLSSLWGRGRALPLLDYPIASSEHFFADSGVVLREDEPSSLIAFTLSSSTYQHRLRTLRASHAESPSRNAIEPFDGEGSLDYEKTRAADRGLELQLREPEGIHLRFEFNSGGCKFHIRTLFAEQFDALRKACDCELSFIQSLSRCVKWDSSGGKSGAAFLKTKDDRFVIKEISRAEMEAFLSGATGYCQYMADAIFGGRPTTLGKIFGCFRISIRNTQTGKSIKLDCLVIENLFYGRQLTKIFDLKGSLRNRHIRETGRADEVLLDENLVEMANKSPLFVREDSKSLLLQALRNDSLWLESQNVMDYSLVVGLDKERKEFVCGIIDYVRTYTWDKKAETWLKEASALGVSKATPTVITPALYRQRFLTFMSSSFLLVPDAWCPPPESLNETCQSTAQGATPVAAPSSANHH
ncbi:1-phosphatidylinositol-3-phosphate 5-kinase [Ceraceosorus bombacis]|uniref:1-phosphatidylinositol-3-phosphate 5-kinase n=1 Tax=Ceraceosorus bombacis TaxID=401625 RepID=A0A0P1BNL2_9BASI|nr:1-phosphatidylinositol-3-phosphate 5-kinase [Ceraceosorus bombacis]